MVGIFNISGRDSLKLQKQAGRGKREETGRFGDIR
jgi:hypothetical protein